MPTTRLAIVGRVTRGLVCKGYARDDCFVEVIALPAAGSARALVRCLYSGVTAHINVASVRP